MALIFANRVLETSTTTGTGTYTLAGAVTGFQTFASVGNSNTCYYYAEEVDGSGVPSGGWEVGLGTYTSSGTTLARTAILASTNSNNAVSWSAGTRRIGNTIPASVIALIQNKPTCKVVLTPSQSIASGSLTSVTFDAADDWDTDAMHDPSSQNTRIVANTAGVFTFSVILEFADNNTGLRIGYYRVNGGTDVPGEVRPANPSGTSTFASYSFSLKLAVNDYIEIRVLQNSGGNLNLQQASCVAVWQGIG